MDEDRRLERNRGVPKLIEIEFPEISPFHVGGDDQSGDTELRHGVFGLARCRGGVR